MAESMQTLESLSTLKPAAPEAPKYVQKIDKQGRAYATGKRKDAVARVWIKPGPGNITVIRASVAALSERTSASRALAHGRVFCATAPSSRRRA